VGSIRRCRAGGVRGGPPPVAASTPQGACAHVADETVGPYLTSTWRPPPPPPPPPLPPRHGVESGRGGVELIPRELGPPGLRGLHRHLQARGVFLASVLGAT
jgi:hypothetical protein